MTREQAQKWCACSNKIKTSKGEILTRRCRRLFNENFKKVCVVVGGGGSEQEDGCLLGWGRGRNFERPETGLRL